MSEKGRDIHEVANCEGRRELGAPSEDAVHGGSAVEEHEVKNLARFEIRIAPVAWLIGIGLAGYGVGGILGAGVALMLPASAVFVGTWLDERITAYVVRDRRRRRTLRHRYFLWLDRRHRKRDEKKRWRRDRKEAERSYLESHKRRRAARR